VHLTFESREGYCDLTRFQAYMTQHMASFTGLTFYHLMPADH